MASGWIQERESKTRGTRYKASVRDENGVHPLGTFDRKGDAQTAIDLHLRGDHPEERATVDLPRMTWGEWKDPWLANRDVAESTRRDNLGTVRRHLAPKWDDVVMADIDVTDLADWQTQLRDAKLAPATIRKIVALFSTSLTDAVRAKKRTGLHHNPCLADDAPKRPSQSEQPDRYLTADEYAALRKAIPGDDNKFFADLLVETGMRFGEAMALHWAQVDLEAGTITVAWSFDRGRFMKCVKTERIRVVPISKKLHKLLSQRLKENGVGKPADVEYRGARRPHTGLVWGSLDDPEWRYMWRATIKRLPLGQVRTQDLRHTYASWRVQDGVPIQVVQQLLGHQSVTTTERYAKLAPNQFDIVKESLNRKR